MGNSELTQLNVVAGTRDVRPDLAAASGASSPGENGGGGGSAGLMGQAANAVLEHLVATLGRQVEAGEARIWLREENSNPAVLKLCSEYRPANLCARRGDLPSARFPDELARECILRRGTVLCADVEGVPRKSAHGAELTETGSRRRMAIPLVLGERVVGVVSLGGARRGCFRPKQVELAEAMARQMALTLQLTHMAGQVRQAAVLEERCRLAQELHDTLAQGFTGIIVQLEAAQDALHSMASTETEGHLRRAVNLARQSLGEARRVVSALRPGALESSSFRKALEGLLSEMTTGTGLRAEFRLEGRERPLLAEREENLLRISQEALTNTLRHAEADRFEACLAFAPNEVRLELRDNGRGFDPRVVRRGFGLKGMRERAERIGAHLVIWSLAEQGTGVRVALPDGPGLPALA